MADDRVEKLADVLTEYSLPVKRDARVLVRGSSVAEPLLLALYARLLDRGAHVFWRLSLPHADPVFFDHAGEEQVRHIWEPDRWLYANCDAFYAVMSDVNPHQLAGADPSKLALLGKARGELLDVQMRRAAAGELRWVLSLFPTEGYATEAGMALAAYERFYYGACLVDRPDPIAAWRELAAELEGVKAWLTGRREVRLEGPGTDLRLGVAGRSWIPCHGDSNFPDGEIFTGPEETVTEGVVSFSFPATYQGQQVEGVRLEFQAGQVVKATADRNEQYLHQLLESDAGARRLGELGIGTNFGITRFTGNTLLDEKIGGTVHLALGAAYPESGGGNQSAIHWDLVCDLRQAGRVTVDGETLMENGRLVI